MKQLLQSLASMLKEMLRCVLRVLPIHWQRFMRTRYKKDMNVFLAPNALRHIRRYEFARDNLSGQRILDVACGAGYGSDLLEPYEGYVECNCRYQETQTIRRVDSPGKRQIHIPARHAELLSSTEHTFCCNC